MEKAPIRNNNQEEIREQRVASEEEIMNLQFYILNAVLGNSDNPENPENPKEASAPVIEWLQQDGNPEKSREAVVTYILSDSDPDVENNKEALAAAVDFWKKAVGWKGKLH